MKITVRADSIVIEGYVNAIERKSKELVERGVHFVERIKEGAFKKALERADDVRIYLNHDKRRDLGGIKDGNLYLEEDAIGLKARATIYDPEVINDGKRGDLVGWSFGYQDRIIEQRNDEETGLPLRIVEDMNLIEVSILNRKKSPAYKGTLVTVRDDGSEDTIMLSEDTIEEEVEIREEPEKAEEPEAGKEERAEELAEDPPKEKVSSDYFARYKNMIAELKRLVKN